MRDLARSFIHLLALVAAIGLVAACADSPDDPGTEPELETVDIVEVDVPTLDLHLGDTVQLTARAYDAAGQPVDGVTFGWSSDDLAVATVTDTGLLTAVGAGEVIISANAGLATGSRFLTVLDDPPPIDHLELTPGGAVALLPGETVQLAAAAYDADGAVLLGRPMTWESDDASVAAVSASGLVTGVAVGSAWIAVISEDQRDEMLVQVRALGDFTLIALDDAALPTLLGSYSETLPEVGTVTRTLRVFDGRLSMDGASQTYEAQIWATLSTQAQASAVPLVVRYESSGSMSWDAAAQTFTFQPRRGAGFSGQWVASGVQIRWQPEPRIAGESTWRFIAD